MPSGTATNRTNIELPTQVSSVILQKAQEESAVMRLARKITLPGWGLTIPVITSDPEASWVDETAQKPVSNPGLTKKVMQAYKLAVIVPFSDEFRRDTKNLYDALIARLPRALGLKFDQTVFGAVEKPGNNFDNFASCTAQSISSCAYDGLVAADTDIAVAGGVLNGYVISPQAKGILLGEKDKDGRPLFINSVAEGAVPMILGSRTLLSKGVYKSGTPDIVGIAGDWTQALYGTVEGIKVSISDQATLTAGTVESPVTINLWQQNMFAVRAEIEIGFRADTNMFNLLTSSAPSGETGATGATGATGETDGA